MTDAKFKQLVNSFLDREISQKDHLLLSREVAASPQRRTEFERYRKLHAAERQALAQLFAVNGGVDPLGDPDEEAAEGLEISAERQQRAEQLKARAARAWSEVQLLTVERKKRRLLIWQFTLAGLALLFAALALYRQSVGAIPGSGNYRKESEALNPESSHLAHLREQLLSRQGISVGWISNERGEPVALVGRNDEGGVFVMTSSELPRLSHLQLSALLNQLPPPASSTPAPPAVLPASVAGVPLTAQQALRNRFAATARAHTTSLPNVDDLLAPPSFATARQQAQAAQQRPPQLSQSRPPQSSQQLQAQQRQQSASVEGFIRVPPQERSVEVEVFWSSTHYHTDIRTSRAAEPESL